MGMLGRAGGVAPGEPRRPSGPADPGRVAARRSNKEGDSFKEPTPSREPVKAVAGRRRGEGPAGSCGGAAVGAGTGSREEGRILAGSRGDRAEDLRAEVGLEREDLEDARPERRGVTAGSSPGTNTGPWRDFPALPVSTTVREGADFSCTT